MQLNFNEGAFEVTPEGYGTSDAYKVIDVHHDDQDRLHREDGPALTVEKVCWDEPLSSEKATRKTAFYVTHGELTAQVETYEGTEREVHFLEKEWYNAAGELHREDGPARTVWRKHQIPMNENGDRDIKEHWINGQRPMAPETERTNAPDVKGDTVIDDTEDFFVGKQSTFLTQDPPSLGFGE